MHHVFNQIMKLLHPGGIAKCHKMFLFFQSLKARLHDKGLSDIIISQDGISLNVLYKETSSQVRVQVQISSNDILVCSLNKIVNMHDKCLFLSLCSVNEEIYSLEWYHVCLSMTICQRI